MQTQMHDMLVSRLRLLLCSAMHVARSGKSSGDELPAPGDYRTGIPEGECHVFGMLEGVMDIRVAYLYSLYFSDQLSCIKFFHQSYGLKDIDFQSFIQFKRISGISFIS